MNHEYINTNQVVERYVMDKLSVEEREAFELHYLSCATCINDIDAAEVFRNELPNVFEPRNSDTVDQRAELTPLWSSMLRSPAYSVVATVLLGVALVASLYLLQSRNEESALRAVLEARLADLVAPQPNTPVVALETRRSGVESIVEVPLPANPGLVILTLSLDEIGHAEYRATLIEPVGVAAWTVESLLPDSTDSLVIAVHSTTLGPGDYRVSIQGRMTGGEWQNVSAYDVRFRTANE